MSQETQRERSPNFPKITLLRAIEIVGQLHSKAGKTQLRPEVVASTLGYGGMNGSALTTIGALSQYGLLERPSKEGIAVSALALRLLHPVNDAQRMQSLRDAALKPKVFKTLYTEGFNFAAENVVSNHLIQNGFTQDGAVRAATVFKANIELSELQTGTKLPDDESDSTHLDTEVDRLNQMVIPTRPLPPPELQMEDSRHPCPSAKSILARYSVPIGDNEAVIVFSGKALRSEDFDALGEYVKLFKKQFERKTKSLPPGSVAEETRAIRAVSLEPEED